jgi:hypothetical protein
MMCAAVSCREAWHPLREYDQGDGRLASDLRRAFPDLKGFLHRNHYTRALPAAYPDEQFVQQVVAQIALGPPYAPARWSPIRSLEQFGRLEFLRQDVDQEMVLLWR